MTIFPLAPGQTIAQMWSNGVRGGAAKCKPKNQDTAKIKSFLQYECSVS